MPDDKRRSSNALPFQKRSSSEQNLRNVKVECEHLREKIQKSIIDNPQAAKKAALLIGMWIEGKARGKKKAA